MQALDVSVIGVAAAFGGAAFAAFEFIKTTEEAAAAVRSLTAASRFFGSDISSDAFENLRSQLSGGGVHQRHRHVGHRRLHADARCDRGAQIKALGEATPLAAEILRSCLTGGRAWALDHVDMAQADRAALDRAMSTRVDELISSARDVILVAQAVRSPASEGQALSHHFRISLHNLVSQYPLGDVQPKPPDRLLSRWELAQFLCIKQDSVPGLMDEGMPYVRNAARSPRFDLRECREWLAVRTRRDARK